MSKGLEKLIKKRRKERDKVIDEALKVTIRLRNKFGKVTVLLYGSFSRGDFNLWSDIDIIIISEAFKGINPLERLELAHSTLPPRFEPKCFTPEEAEFEFKKPWWNKIVEESVVLADDYHLFDAKKKPKTV